MTAPAATAAPRRTALLWLLCAALGLAALYGRTLWSARTHLLLGEQAAFGQDREGAVRELGRAAREQAPGNVYADRAVVALLEVARDYEEGRRGPVDREAARRAYMTVRAALLGARHFRTPHSVPNRASTNSSVSHDFRAGYSMRVSTFATFV